MKNNISVFLIIAVMLSILISAGCGGPPVAPVGQGSIPSVLADNYTSVTPAKAPIPVKADRVELIYFHTKVACHCMAVVQDNIQYAVDTYFKNEVANGKVKLTMIVSDDPANAALVEKYDAMLFTLLIKETRGNAEKIYPVSNIWNMTGDDNRDRLVNFIKTTVNNILEGKSS